MTDERLDEIKTRWNIPVTLPMTVPWGKDDVVWLVQEVERLRAEAQRADEEATKLANSDLATTEQVIRALRAEHARLIAAAPDLLAACEAVAATTWSRNTATIIGEQVRAAVAKAKGEKP